MPTLIDEALQIAQEHGLKIIACGQDKAPIHTGWRSRASSDPAEIRKMFSDPRAKLVGVPTGKDNDLLVFDLDYREGNTLERNDKLWVFANKLEAAHPGQIRIHKTRNGGRHMIMLNPDGAKKIPRNIMPKAEVCGEGFQIIWPTEGSGYEVLVDVPLDELTEPDLKFLKVLEKMEGISSSGGLMSAELAQQVMVSDGEVGTRHDALLRMTYDFVAGAPDDLEPDELCERFEEQFRSIYGDYIEGSRLEELMHWTYDGGELGGSDLGNAMRGAIARHPERGLHKMSSMERPAFSAWNDAGGEMLEEPPIDPQHLPQVTPQIELPDGLIGWDEPIKPRQWLLSHRVERGEVSVFQAPPGAGKTATMMGWIGVVASGVAFLNEKAWGGPRNVVYLNGDDARAEILRRLKAFSLKHKNAGSLLKGRVRYLDQRIVLAQPDPEQPKKIIENSSNVDVLTEKLAEWDTDLLIVDPLPSIHEIREGDAGEMQVLLRTLRRLARKLNIGIVVVQHWKPPAEGEAPIPNPINGMARHVTQMRVMKASEAQAYAQPEDERHRFLRIWDAKANNEAQTAHAWLKLERIPLGNGDDVYGEDSVAVVTRWEPGSDPKMAVKIEHSIRLLREEWERPVHDSERNVLAWANSPRWFGQLIVKHLMEGQVLQDGVAKDKVGEKEQQARTEAQGIINTLSELKLITKQQDVPGSNRALTWGYHVNDHKFDAGLWKAKIK